MKLYAVEVEVEPGLWATYMVDGYPCEFSTSLEAHAVASWLWQSAQCWESVRVSEVAIKALRRWVAGVEVPS